MDSNINNSKKIIAAILIAIYGLSISFAIFFMFMWDNKGAKSVWDKSISDWAFVVWLFVASALIWFGVFKCISNNYISKLLIVFLSLVFIVHLSIVVIGSSNEALAYLGTPNLFLGTG